MRVVAAHQAARGSITAIVAAENSPEEAFLYAVIGFIPVKSDGT
jgi:hypothetical protein